MRCTLRWEGKVDLEDWRARMETVKWGSESKAETTDGPRLPPAPIMITFLIGEDIFDGFGDITKVRE